MVRMSLTPHEFNADRWYTIGKTRYQVANRASYM